MKTTTTTTTKTKTNNYKNKNENNKNKTGTNVILSSTQARHIQYVHHGTPTQQTRVKSLGQSSGMSTRLSRLPPPPQGKTRARYVTDASLPTRWRNAHHKITTRE